MLSEHWGEVTKDKPCPVCGKTSWCFLAKDGGAVVCRRAESGLRTMPGGGYLIRLRDDWKLTPRKHREVRLKATNPPPADYLGWQGAFALAVDSGPLGRLSLRLGVSATALRRLGIGWCVEHKAWTFPTHDEHGHIIGFALRSDAGAKWFLPGGRAGVYLPAHYEPMSEGFLIVEGATDCAALLDLGFVAVGRFSCTGNADILLAAVRRVQPKSIVIVADNDTPKRRRDGSFWFPGQDGANRLASQLSLFCEDLRVIKPPDPYKDVRQWKNASIAPATHDAVLELIDNAEPFRAGLRATVRIGRKR